MKVLQKGQKINLESELTSLSFFLNINWDDHPNYDIDTSLILLSENNLIEEENDFIFYNNPKSSDKSISIKSKKEISFDLNKISNKYKKVLLLMTIDNGERLNQNFGNIKNISVDLIDSNQNKKLSFPIEGMKEETAIILLELYSHNGTWKVKAVGNGFNSGLEAIINQYGSDKVKVSNDEPNDSSSSSNQRQKVNNNNTKFQTVLGLDLSFKMSFLLRNGNVQNSIDKLFPALKEIDSDSKIDVWCFNDEVNNHKIYLTNQNKENYISNEILTNYYLSDSEVVPLINAINQKYNNKSIYVLIVTNGIFEDFNLIESSLSKNSNNIFWKFICIDPEINNFSLEKLNSQSNVDAVNLVNFDNLSDLQAKEKLFQKFNNWKS